MPDLDQSKSSASIQRCHATILFADISGSTRLAELTDPESLANILQHVRQMADAVISQYGGVINQFYGDGVLAAFGYPVPHENDVLHATEAALKLHEAIAQLPVEHLLPNGFKLQLHTGVHAGLMVVQEGDRLQGQYKLYGDALNTAARLADAAEAGETFASAVTLRGVLPYFNCEPVDPLSLKGKSQPLEAFKVISRSDISTRFEASKIRGLSPFIGRQKEIEQLNSLLSSAFAGSMQLVIVHGAAGLGKTRLIEEFLNHIPSSKNSIFRAYCQSDTSAVPLQPFIQILHQIFRVEPSDHTEETIELVRQQLNKLDSDLIKYDKDLSRLLSLSEPGNDEEQSRHYLKFLISLSKVLATKEPVFIFIDDWHWADDASRQVLGTLVQELKDLPVFIVLSSRHEELSDSMLKAFKLSLSPLSYEETLKAIDNIFPDASLWGWEQAIFERSGGNVLFVEELCQTIQADLNTQQNIKDISHVPATLYGLIESRMDRLQDEHSKLVKSASVIGIIVPTWLLERLIGYQLSEDILSELAHHDLLYQKDDNAFLQFKHGLTRDVIYQSVSLHERRALHLRIAAILEEETNAQGSDEFYEALASHYFSAGENIKASQYAEFAGDKASASRALDRARIQYQLALEALEMVAEEDAYYQRWNKIVEKLGWTCVFDPHNDQTEILEKAVELARQHKNSVSLAKSEYWLSYIYYALGDSKKAILYSEHSFNIAKKINDRGLIIHSLSVLAQARATACDYDRALNDFDEVMRLRGYKSNSNKISIGSAFGLACKATVCADMGYFDQAHYYFDQAKLGLIAEKSEVEGSVLALQTAVYIWQGRWHEASNVAMQAQEVASAITNTYVFAQGQSQDGYAKWKLQRDRDGVACLLSATEWLEHNGKELFVSLNYGQLADCYAESGELALARKFAARALMRARKQDYLGLGTAFRALAKVTLKDGNVLLSERYMRHAFRAAEIRQSRHEKATNLLCQAELCGINGDVEQAITLLNQAHTEFDAMQMLWHGQQAQQLLDQLI